jgi:hypothetical protein
MSLRNRIVVAGLLITLAAPSAGWTILTDRDPDGQQVRVSSVPLDESDRDQPGVEGAIANLRTERSAPQDEGAFVFDRFQDWLRALFALSF